MFPAAISHHFPRFPGISQVPPRASSAPEHCRRPGHRLHGCIALPRATVLACMSHQAAMRSPGGSQDANQAFPHRPRQTGATRSRRPAVPPASGFGVTRHETRNTRHGFFQTRITAFPEAWPLRSFDSPWMRKGRATGNRRPDHSACRPVTACLCAVERLWRGWSGCCGAGGAAWSGILPLNQCPRSVRRSRLASLRTPREPMLRKRNVLHSADTRAVSVAGILPSEYNGRTAAAKGMCI